MLEKTEPFKSMLDFFNFCGLWKTNSHQKSKKIYALIAFLLFQPLPLFLILFSLIQDNSFYTVIRMITIASSYLLTMSYIVFFWLNEKKIQDFFDDFNETIQSSLNSQAFINLKCLKAKKIELAKVSVTGFWLLNLTFISLFTRDLRTPLWEPEFLRHFPGIFYLKWAYHTGFMAYTSIVGLLAEDFCFSLLMTVKGYGKYFEHQLTTLDVNGKIGRANLLECVKIHQNIRR